MSKNEPEPLEHGPKQPDQPSVDGGFRWGLVIAIILAIALVALAVQNTQSVRIEWLFWDLSAPLVTVLLVTAIAAIFVSQIMELIWRRRKRRRLEEKAELERLRAEREQER
jgi:uncharacterized integral membrane protein